MNSTSSSEENKQYKDELDTLSTLTPPSSQELAAKQVFLGPTTKRYTLVLDIDKTLVYTGPMSATGKETNDGKEYILTVRPYAVELIERLSPKFEIIIFTSADDQYAKQVYDYFNGTNGYLSGLFTKTSCIALKEGYIVKDLRIFADRALDKMLIVDDSILSFAFQLENGVPVVPYDGSADDEELLRLAFYLEGLYSSENIVKANKEFMKLAH